MALVLKKPVTPGERGRIQIVHKHLHKGRPYQKLVKPLAKKGGRNNVGHITVRHRGGGHKRLYRLIDFKRIKDNLPAIVERIEYDPNRTAHIALICYKDGVKNYILAPRDLRQGDTVTSGSSATIKSGNCLPLQNIPVGTNVHCVELTPGKGAQLARSAGATVQLIAKEENYAIVRLRSGEMRKIRVECRATIGEVSNEEHNLSNLGKAGATRWRGRRPHVRGVAMNPVDHPHGGGEGRTSGGRHPVTPWGVPTKGYKTRRNKRTDKYILKRAKQAKG